jgi:CubicO group peptidase (beta-lactamase class C family)
MRAFTALAFACVWVAGARAADMVPSPAGQDKTPFPTVEWAERDVTDPLRQKIEAVVARAFEGARPPALAKMRAMVVTVRGRIAGERYSEGVTRDTRLQSWSMAKSMLNAAIGLAAADGKIDPEAPAKVPEWQGADDPRRAITVRQLMQMTDGLAFREDYGDTDAEVMQMLFGGGRGDVGRSAAATPAGHPPGTVWSYSSGSANILSRLLRDALGGREAYAAFVKERLFAPLGMRSAVAEFDASGTWIGSSYVHATARDFARFGELYLANGYWDGRQLLPAQWVRSACTASAPAKGRYGELFWLNAPDPATGASAISAKVPTDVCIARGFGGQLITIAPTQGAVIVMLNAAYGDDIEPIIDLIADVLAATGAAAAPE